jgi:hypothetical protein
VFSVNKMLRRLSNVGRGFCRGRSRIHRETWVTDFAWWCGQEMALGSRELLLEMFVAFWGAVAEPWGTGERDFGDR